MAGVTIDQTSNVWEITYNAGGSLPATLWDNGGSPLIPKRIKVTFTTATAGDKVEFTDGTGEICFRELATGANADPPEQRPNGHEAWIGPVTVTTFAPTVANVLIYI